MISNSSVAYIPMCIFICICYVLFCWFEINDMILIHINVIENHVIKCDRGWEIINELIFEPFFTASHPIVIALIGWTKQLCGI